MLGAAGVGKTTLCHQFMTSEHINAYDNSLGKYTPEVLNKNKGISIRAPHTHTFKKSVYKILNDDNNNDTTSKSQINLMLRQNLLNLFYMGKIK